MKQQSKKLIGILLCAGIAAVATAICNIKIGQFSFELIGAPVIAILAGMLIALALPQAVHKEPFQSGIQFTAKKILQWAVIILGFSLDLGTIAAVGGKKFAGHHLYHCHLPHCGIHTDESAAYSEKNSLSNWCGIFYLRWFCHCCNRSGH